MDNVPTLEPRPSIINLRMVGFAKRNATRTFYKKSEEQFRVNQLYRIKTEPIIKLRVRTVRENSALCCMSCTPYSRKNVTETRPGGLDIQNIFRFPHNGCFFRKQFKNLLFYSNVKKFSYPDVNKIVVQHENVEMAIKKLALAEIGFQKNKQLTVNELNKLELLKQKYTNEAVEILHGISSKLSDGILKFVSWVLSKVLSLIFTNVLVFPEQITLLQQASEKNLTLVYLPLHRSQIDHILISFILISLGLKAPISAVEANDINIPIIGWISRLLGAFCLDSEPDNTPQRSLYVPIVQSYLTELLKAGQPIELFLEGEHTRSGKTGLPQRHVMSIIVNMIMDRSIKDALIVPVGLNYECLIHQYLSIQHQSNMSRFRKFMTFMKVLNTLINSKHGMMRVDFGQPFSLVEFRESYLKLAKYKRNFTLRNVQESNRMTMHSVKDECYSIEEFLARHVLFDCERNMTTMSTNAIAFILLYHFRRGTTMCRLVSELSDLILDLRSSKRDVCFSGELEDVVNHALHLLGPNLIHTEVTAENTIFIKPIIQMQSIMELSYYANGVISCYTQEAVLATALCSLQNNSTWSLSKKCFISRDTLMNKALDICHILQFEFIFNTPCRLLSDIIYEKIDTFNVNGILNLEADVIAEKEGTYRQRRYMGTDFDFDNKDSDDYVIPKSVNYFLNEERRPMIQVLCNILRPFFEAYVACAVSLTCLLRAEKTEDDLLKCIRNQAEARLEEGTALYMEGLSNDIFLNALKLFQKWNIIECYTYDQVTIYCLTENYDSVHVIHSLCQKLSAFVCTVE